MERIVSHADILRDKPCIKGTRISVEFILELAASGASRQEIVAAYPQLTTEDVDAALRYAARFMSNELMLAGKTLGPQVVLTV